MKKIALVTGAYGWLGESVATLLSEHGYLVYAGTRYPLKHHSTESIRPVKIDITSDISVKRAISLLKTKHKKIDAVVNCVGKTIVGPTLDFSSNEFKAILDINLIGNFRLMKAAYPIMKPDGAYVSITSLNGIVSLPNFGLYSSSKFGIEALSAALHIEYPVVRFVTIAPGAIHNPNAKVSKMPHKPAREKFFLLKLLLPMITREEIAQSIYHYIEDARDTSSCIVMGRDAKITYVLSRFLPQRMWNYMLKTLWQR